MIDDLSQTKKERWRSKEWDLEEVAEIWWTKKCLLLPLKRAINYRFLPHLSTATILDDTASKWLKLDFFRWKLSLEVFSYQIQSLNLVGRLKD